MSAAVRSICPFCSLGCSFLARGGDGSAYHGESAEPALEFDPEGAANRGSLCAKGCMALELMTRPERCAAPTIRRDGRRRSASWDAALGAVVEGLLRARESGGADSIGVLAGAHLTREEVRLAARLARDLGTPNLDACLVEDRAALVGPDLAGARPDPVRSVGDVERSTAILAVGDLFTLAPCLAKPVLASRYDRRQNTLAVLESTRSRTAWFAKPLLPCLPGRETAALALLLRSQIEKLRFHDAPWVDAAVATLDPLEEEELSAMSGLPSALARTAADALDRETSSAVLLAGAFAGRERDVLASGLAALLAEVTGSLFLSVTDGPNAAGGRGVLGEEGFPRRHGRTAAEMIESAVTGDLRALVVLGCDPLAALPGRIPSDGAGNLEFLAVTTPMPGETSEVADVVLPSAAWGEKRGTVRDAWGEERSLAVALPPPGAARPDADILRDLIDRLGAARGGGAAEERARPVRADRGASAFFVDLDLYLRQSRRERTTPKPGTHLLLPRPLPPHAGDGWLTRRLSWPLHEFPEGFLSVSPGHAERLGARDGDRVLVRSRWGEAALILRVERRVPEGAVLAPPHFPEVRRLVAWRLDPVLRTLDLPPERVSVEVVKGVSGG